MKEVTPPKLPDSCENFAKAVAAIAESHGVDQFQMTFRPDFEKDHESRRLITGDMKIVYSSKDGRGRPCRKLNINLTANLGFIIENEPESY